MGNEPAVPYYQEESLFVRPRKGRICLEVSESESSVVNVNLDKYLTLKTGFSMEIIHFPRMHMSAKSLAPEPIPDQLDSPLGV